MAAGGGVAQCDGSSLSTGTPELAGREVVGREGAADGGSLPPASSGSRAARSISSSISSSTASSSNSALHSPQAPAPVCGAMRAHAARVSPAAGTELRDKLKGNTLKGKGTCGEGHLASESVLCPAEADRKIHGRAGSGSVCGGAKERGCAVCRRETVTGRAYCCVGRIQGLPYTSQGAIAPVAKYRGVEPWPRW